MRLDLAQTDRVQPLLDVGACVAAADDTVGDRAFRQSPGPRACADRARQRSQALAAQLLGLTPPIAQTGAHGGSGPPSAITGRLPRIAGRQRPS
jgi:hypothetical protein